jgi:hypothetical protein
MCVIKNQSANEDAKECNNIISFDVPSFLVMTHNMT